MLNPYYQPKFFEILEDMIIAKGWTISEFAKFIGINEKELLKIQDNNEILDTKYANRMSYVLGLSQEFFINLSQKTLQDR